LNDSLSKAVMARRRFVRRTTVAVLAFAALYVGLSALLPSPAALAGLALAFVITAPLFWWAYEYQRYVRALDEFQSLLSLQAIAISAGAALLIGALWGVAEKFLGAAHLNAALLLPLAVLIHALAHSFLARRYQ